MTKNTVTLKERKRCPILVCRQLDRVRHDEGEIPQLYQFTSGEGGTGKSRIIEEVSLLVDWALYAMNSSVDSGSPRGISERSPLSSSMGTSTSSVLSWRGPSFSTMRPFHVTKKAVSHRSRGANTTRNTTCGSSSQMSSCWTNKSVLRETHDCGGC